MLIWCERGTESASDKAARVGPEVLQHGLRKKKQGGLAEQAQD